MAKLRSKANKKAAKAPEPETESEDEVEEQKPESPFLKECIEHFESSDFYHILGIQKTAAIHDIKKAYYRLSLKFHPDKAEDESSKASNGVKFQIIGRIYKVLSDTDSRSLYDSTGQVEGEEGSLPSSSSSWDEYFRDQFKKISTEDIVKFFETYRDSPQEKEDLLKAYEKHKGQFDLILEDMFSEDSAKDEERFKKIIQESIDNGEVKAFKAFVNESSKKAAKRKAFYEREAEEAKEMSAALNLGPTDESLKNAIMARRGAANANFLQQLEEKYSKPSAAKGKKKNAKAEDDEDVENTSRSSAKSKKVKRLAK